MNTTGILSLEQARELAARYPWFNIPEIIKYRTNGTVGRRLAILSRFRPAILKVPEAIHDNIQTAYATMPDEKDTMSIIDAFIRSGEHRITAADTTPEDLPDTDNNDDAIPDELLTEEFASIYLAQGMNDRAVEIYRRLSLLNPEKSIYFAELIEKASGCGTRPK